MRMWMPFAGAAGAENGPARPPETTAKDEGEIEALRRQLQEMQKTIETIAKKD